MNLPLADESIPDSRHYYQSSPFSLTSSLAVKVEVWYIRHQESPDRKGPLIYSIQR
jgi:hypothetical protein